MSPLGRRESPWSSTEGSGFSPPSPGCRGPGSRPVVKTDQGKPSTSPTSSIYLSKFAVLHIEDPILHRSLHGPSAALAASAKIRDQQQRKCDCCSRSNCMGQTSFLSDFPFLVCGMRGRGWATGGVRLSALPLAEGQWGRTHTRQSTGSIKGTARHEHSTRHLAPAASEHVWGTATG